MQNPVAGYTYSDLFDRYDDESSAAENEYSFWSSKYEKTATAAEKSNKQIELINKKIGIQAKALTTAEEEYTKTKDAFGEESRKTQEAYARYLKEQIEYQQLVNSLNNAELDRFDKQNERYALEMKTYSNQQSILLKLFEDGDYGVVTSTINMGAALRNMSYQLKRTTNAYDKYNEYVQAGTQNTDDGLAALHELQDERYSFIGYAEAFADALNMSDDAKKVTMQLGIAIADNWKSISNGFNDLRNYYREEGTNEGYVLFIDFSGYYANIQHEPCKAVLHELLEKSGLSDELRIITEDLMDEIFKTFEMDVSRFSDEDIEAMMNGKVDPFMNMGVPKELLTGEKMLAKGTDIGNQLAQNIGIVFPYRIDNYCKIVCGMKHQGRYSDDMHIIHRSKEVLLKVLEGVKTIAAEYGLILNEKKTHICKLSGEYRYLQVKYTLLQNGIVVRRIHPKAITRERRKLKAYKRLLDKGIVTMEEIDGYFRSWLSGNYKYMSRDQIYKMNSLYVKLFGRSVTWKKGHGRLRWLMAHPSAA